jgi:hypothetical protein
MRSLGTHMPSHLHEQRSIWESPRRSTEDGRVVIIARLTGRTSIVSVLSDIDSSSYLSFYDSVTSELYEHHCRCLIIDLTLVSFCSACGLSCLVHKRMTQHTNWESIYALPSRHPRRWQASGGYAIYAIYATL